MAGVKQYLGLFVFFALIGAYGRAALGAEWLAKISDPRAPALLEEAGFEFVHAYRHFPWAVYRCEPEAVARLRSLRAGALIPLEPAGTVELCRTPNDPNEAQQWMIHPAAADADIRLSKAWDIRTSAGGVVVAVIDTGMQLEHPDLAANLWTNGAESNGQAGVDDDGNGYADDLHGWNTYDDNGNVTDLDAHGTAVCGLIGARGNNGEGLAGVCWDVKIMPLRAFTSTDLPLVNALAAIDYALDFPQVRVLNMSWGIRVYNNALYDAIWAAGNKGVVVVASAGNGYKDLDSYPFYPACYDLSNIVSVAAIDQTGALWWNSNYGSKIAVAAPGDQVQTTSINGSYYPDSGTSFATAIVSGAAALLLAHEPGLTASRAQARILETSRRTTALSGSPAGAALQGGLLDVEAMLLLTVNASRDWERYR